MWKVSFQIYLSEKPKRHKLDKHSSKETEFIFPDCDKVLTQKKNMQWHQLSHKKSSYIKW